MAKHKQTDPFYLSEAWRNLRTKALSRDGWRCTCCGRSVAGKGKARVDHIVPRKERPELELVLGNLRTLCTDCDNKRHAEKKRSAPPRQPVNLNGYPAGWSEERGGGE